MCWGAAMRKSFQAVLISTLFIVGPTAGAFGQSCPAGPPTLQILGSGGPGINSERASTSYLDWIDGRARMLIDMGGGSYLQFGQSRAKLSDISLIAVSHLHPDHVSDLPALLWLSRQVRTEALPIVGPSGNSVAGPAASDVAPDFATFLSRLFNDETGAFQVVGGTLGGRGAGVRLNVTVVDAKKAEPSTVFEGPEFKVTAFGIPHADMPTLAYRVETPNGTIVFSSDQNGSNPKFIDFAKNADVLVMHMQIATGTTNPLHAPPAVIGRIAQAASIGRLIVSHIGLIDVEAAVADVKKEYAGPLIVAADLQCTPIAR